MFYDHLLTLITMKDSENFKWNISLTVLHGMY